MKNKLLHVILLLSVLACSCNDWLDVKPKTEKDEKSMFNTANGFKNALIACYVKLNSSNLFGKRLLVTDIEYMAQHWSWTEANYMNQRMLKNFYYEADYPQEFFSTVYRELYNTIAQANIILKNISEHKDVMANEDLRAIVEGEALAIRAFCHMEVLRLFGQVPQNATIKVELPYAEMVSTELIPYYTFSDFVQLILRDMDAAEALFKDHDPLFDYTFEELDNFSDTENYNVSLEDDFLGYRRFRFNYYAMKALKARLYLYLGEKEKAYKLAMEVIRAVDKNGNKVLSLAGNKDIQNKNYALPSECILALSNYDLEKNVMSMFDITSATRIYLTEQQFSQDLFAGQSTSVNNRALIWDLTVNTLGSTLPTPMKYNQPESSDNTDINELVSRKQVIPLVLSELYLVAMETSTSLDEINRLYAEYMKERGVMANTLTQDQVMTEIVREYRREFFAEGQMFYAYKRWGAKNMLWKTDREVRERDYVAPLPNTELKTNKE